VTDQEPLKWLMMGFVKLADSDSAHVIV